MSNEITLFDPFNIGNLRIKNRIISSAIYERAAKDGHISSEIMDYYHNIASGGVGLAITGMQGISDGSVNGPAMIKTTYNEYVSDMRKIVDLFHYQDCKLFVQLQHAGYKTAWQHNGDMFGVSNYKDSNGAIYHEATPKELRKLVYDFGQAALRCKEAGCDGVEIHAVHGYLLHTFLSPYFNHRLDNYGGSIINRARLLFEVYEEVRKQVGKDFCIVVKFPCNDLVIPSITPQEVVWVCQQLEQRGVDALEISAGITRDGGPASFVPFAKTSKVEGNFSEGAALIASNLHIPVISVGGYRTPQYIDNVLTNTHIAAVALGRPIISEPNLVKRWQTDTTKARCISCNGCFLTKGIVSCVLKNK